MTSTDMQKRVLIVDDALIMRQRIKQIALQAGWQIAGEAQDGVAALEFFRQEKPQLVTLDIVMPNMAGVDTLKQMEETIGGLVEALTSHPPMSMKKT